MVDPGVESVSEYSGPGAGYGLSVHARNLRLNELHALARLALVISSVGGARRGARTWLREIAAARCSSLLQVIVE